MGSKGKRKKKRSSKRPSLQQKLVSFRWYFVVVRSKRSKRSIEEDPYNTIVFVAAIDQQDHGIRSKKKMIAYCLRWNLIIVYCCAQFKIWFLMNEIKWIDKLVFNDQWSHKIEKNKICLEKLNRELFANLIYVNKR